MVIKILVTGGTFDKEYNELDGSLFFKKTHIYGMFASGRCKAELNIRTVMLIDSLDMMERDREIIAEYCMDSEENNIIVTHGTDTMVETAKVLAGKSDLKHKTIVLTGAMVPFVFGSSDGLFNLGAAMAYVQILSPGVYVAMNGKHFMWDNVKKNKETGEFERIKSTNYE